MNFNYKNEAVHYRANSLLTSQKSLVCTFHLVTRTANQLLILYASQIFIVVPHISSYESDFFFGGGLKNDTNMSGFFCFY